MNKIREWAQKLKKVVYSRVYARMWRESEKQRSKRRRRFQVSSTHRITVMGAEMSYTEYDLNAKVFTQFFMLAMT